MHYPSPNFAGLPELDCTLVFLSLVGLISITFRVGTRRQKKKEKTNWVQNLCTNWTLLLKVYRCRKVRLRDLFHVGYFGCGLVTLKSCKTQDW